MPLLPSLNSRTTERILVYGYQNSGKSFGWTTWADMARRTNTPGMFHVVSTEWQMADRALEGYEDVDRNVTIHEVQDWPELVNESAKVRLKAAPGDVLVVDSIGAAWSWVQNHYSQERWGMDMATYIMDPAKGEINWTKINGMYQGWFMPNVLRFPGHVYATCTADAIRMPSEKGGWKSAAEIVHKFGKFGVAPEGQKGLGYQFHTVLLAQCRGWDEYILTTVDDPRRDRLNEVAVAPEPFGFVKTYLQDVAGWRVVSNE